LLPGKHDDLKAFYVKKYQEQLTREKNQRNIEETRRKNARMQSAGPFIFTFCWSPPEHSLTEIFICSTQMQVVHAYILLQ